MAFAPTCIGLQLKDIAAACGVTGAEAEAEHEGPFKALHTALRSMDIGLPWKELYAAVSASEARPWPSHSLMQDTVTLLKGACRPPQNTLLKTSILSQGQLLAAAGACTHSQLSNAAGQAAGSSVHAQNGSGDTDHIMHPADSLKLALTLLCHTLCFAAEACLLLESSAVLRLLACTSATMLHRIKLLCACRAMPSSTKARRQRLRLAPASGMHASSPRWQCC